MAIMHATASVIGKSGGKSAVGGAAYSRGASMTQQSTGKQLTYLSKHEVGATGILVPADAPEWLTSMLAEHEDEDRQSEALWNNVEANEKRADGTLAREFEVALPHEFDSHEHVELVEEFAQAMFVDKGMVVDYAIHDLEDNPHAHILTTLRPLTEEGWGPKKVAQLDERGNVLRAGEGEKSRIVYKPFWGDKESLKEERATWAAMVNNRLAAKGVDARIDHRSFKDRGIDLVPSEHRGIFANAVDKKGISSPRLDAQRERQAGNLEAIRARPEMIVRLVTDQQSVFTANDVSRAIARYVWEPEEFATAQAAVMQCDQLVQLTEEIEPGYSPKEGAKAHYTSMEIVRLEADMVDRAERMASSGLDAKGNKPFSARGMSVQDADDAIDKIEDRHGFKLSDEQVAAVHALTVPDRRLVCIVGLAGAGKSTLLEAARESWQQRGLDVQGVALAGKAAEGLQAASGIQSRTLASVSVAQDMGREKFGHRDVIVLDEAGMVGSREMATLLERADKAGAKVVLVGDPAQLPAIGAGAAFRGITDRTGYTEVSEVRRQSEPWQRAASVSFARGNAKAAIEAYAHNGHVQAYEDQAKATDGVASAYARAFPGKLTERDGAPQSDRLTGMAALAHTNASVRSLNASIREKLVASGKLDQGAPQTIRRGLRDAAGRPSEEARIHVAPGERIVLLQNNRQLDVKNGTLATVTQVNAMSLDVRLADDTTRNLPASYNTYDHGYALTIHKSQGATFDKVHVLAGNTMDRNLSYVAMTRHSERVDLHYGRAEFGSEDRQKASQNMIARLSRVSEKSITTDYNLDGILRSGTEQGPPSVGARVAFGVRRGLNAGFAVLAQLRGRLASFSNRFDRQFTAQPRSLNQHLGRVPSGNFVRLEADGSLPFGALAIDANGALVPEGVVKDPQNGGKAVDRATWVGTRLDRTESALNRISVHQKASAERLSNPDETHHAVMEAIYEHVEKQIDRPQEMAQYHRVPVSDTLKASLEGIVDRTASFKADTFKAKFDKEAARKLDINRNAYLKDCRSLASTLLTESNKHALDHAGLQAKAGHIIPKMGAQTIASLDRLSQHLQDRRAARDVESVNLREVAPKLMVFVDKQTSLIEARYGTMGEFIKAARAGDFPDLTRPLHMEADQLKGHEQMARLSVHEMEIEAFRDADRSRGIGMQKDMQGPTHDRGQSSHQSPDHSSGHDFGR